MSYEKHFVTEEEILKELRRQQEESDGEEDEYEVDSETEDHVLKDENREEDIFTVDSADIFPESPAPNLTEIDRNFILGKDMETIWTDKTLSSTFSRVSATNLITHLPGPKGCAKGVTDPTKLFSLFLNDETINSIVTYTNKEIEVLSASYKSKQWYLFPTNIMEMKALFGLLYYMGALKNSDLNTLELFSPVHGPSLIRAGLSRNRFIFLLRALRFDDKATREVRKEKDKFAAFRDLWNKFEENCARHYTPSEYMTVDETLLSFRGRCPFKMYIPSKPDRYGLKIISLCDARTFYFLKGIPYVGKGTAERRSELSMPTQYVLRLTESFADTNRNVTCDNWFTSYELCEELTKKKLTLVGTLRQNKPQIPPVMLTKAPVYSSYFLYQPDKTIVSFTPKQNKKVILLSTMHRTSDVDSTTKKPEIIEFYNLTKGGVDVLDKLCHDKTTKRMTRRWPLRFFYGLLDIAAINCFILYKWNMDKPSYSSQARSNFLKSLAFDLIEPWMKERIKNIHIPKSLRLTIRSVLQIEESDSEEVPSNTVSTVDSTNKKRKRCAFCETKKDRKGNYICVKCNKHLCGEHKKIICPLCASTRK